MGGPALAGFVIKYSGIRSLWLVIGILALIAAAMMYRLYYAYRDEGKGFVQEATNNR